MTVDENLVESNGSRENLMVTKLLIEGTSRNLTEAVFMMAYHCYRI